MARPNKVGLDYFPLDVTMDDKIDLIEAKHGLIGFAIVIKLFQRIYKNGYFIEWSEEQVLLFKRAINVDINLINEVINDCLCYHLFDKSIHLHHNILTSSGIQKRFLGAVDRRNSVNLYRNLIIVNINDFNVNINWINDYISTQSKVKYSKEDNNTLDIKIIVENFEKRKKDFATSLIPFVEIYGKEMIRKFCDYWTEPNKSKTKFKQEMQKTWDTGLRLKNWASRNNVYEKPLIKTEEQTSSIKLIKNPPPKQKTEEQVNAELLKLIEQEKSNGSITTNPTPSITN